MYSLCACTRVLSSSKSLDTCGCLLPCCSATLTSLTTGGCPSGGGCVNACCLHGCIASRCLGIYKACAAPLKPALPCLPGSLPAWRRCQRSVLGQRCGAWRQQPWKPPWRAGWKGRRRSSGSRQHCSRILAAAPAVVATSCQRCVVACAGVYLRAGRPRSRPTGMNMCAAFMPTCRSGS